MATTLDFSNIEKRDFTPLEAGKYELTIDSVEEVTFNSGNPGIKVVYKEPETGKKIWDNVVFTDAALWKVQELLDACGYDTEAEVTVEWLDLVGATILAEVTQEEYNGKVNNKIGRVYPC